MGDYRVMRFNLNPDRIYRSLDRYPKFLDNAIEISHDSNANEVTLTEFGFAVDVPLRGNIEYSIDLLDSYNDKTGGDEPFNGVDEANLFYLKTLLDTYSRETSFVEFLSKVEFCGVTSQEAAERLKSSELFDLEAEQAEELVAEFEFMIDVIRENTLNDFYRLFNLSYRPLYRVLYNAARSILTQKLDFRKMRARSKKIPNKRVRSDIISGMSLLEIYEKTGVTKKRIKEIVNTLPYKDMPEGSKARFEIEKVLFGIKDCRYKHNISFDDFRRITGADFDGVYDFAVYQNRKVLFLIDYDAEYHLKYIKPDCETQEWRRTKEEYCRASNIPLLRIDSMEFEDEWEGYYVSTEIRNAFKNPETIEEHNIRREAAAICNYIEHSEYDDKHFCGNYEDSISAAISGCYNCGAVFTPDIITKWDNNCPFCPLCEKQTIIFDSQGFCITEKIMRELVNEYWGNTEKADLMTGVSIDEMKPFKYIDKITLLYQDNDSHFPTTERLVIDGKSEKITYIREWMIRQNSKNKTTNEYFAPSHVSSFIDKYAFVFRLFDNETEQNTDPCLPMISITVYYVDKTEEQFVRNYDRNNLPLSWTKFMNGLRMCIQNLDNGLFGDLFQDRLYNQGVREGEYIFLSVVFNSYGSNKSYYYLTDDDSVCIGDYVTVPVGNSNTAKTVQVENKEYFKADDVPIPLEKVKSIISKYDDEDEETDEPEDTDNELPHRFYCPLIEWDIEKWECIGIRGCIDDGTERNKAG